MSIIETIKTRDTRSLGYSSCGLQFCLQNLDPPVSGSPEEGGGSHRFVDDGSIIGIT